MLKSNKKKSKELLEYNSRKISEQEQESKK